ncbi:MAG: 16S rRNA (cytidine(1402)-2'-O)-methyltransferase [Thermoflexales bacterium]|nr:16S rRNA (cytidine(1402)-2'-O)-methyltransferase [Thermoflexales bacterium]
MGTLYLVATPIGNLEDITLRALRVLREVSLIAAEDTRTARLLLSHYGISTPVTSYFEGNWRQKTEYILRRLEEGDVALISEAGMPGLSDPGYELVRAALARGFLVTAVPGPTALVTALVLSGLPTDRFLYLGFLPRRASERRALLGEIAGVRWTLVAFEAPHRLRESLADLESVLGDRPIAVCRELTKMFEEVWRGTVSGARAYFAEREPRGEFTLVIGGAPGEEPWDEARVRAALQERLQAGLLPALAAREVAVLSGWPRREVYALIAAESTEKSTPDGTARCLH